MKAKSFLSIALFLFCFPALVTTGHALQVSQNTYEDAFPFLNGNHLVWQGKVDGDWEIFLYDTQVQQTVQITDNDYNDISPQTDGDYVVWLAYNNAGGEIFTYNISDQTTVPLTNNSFVENAPRIFAGKVVWSSFEVTDSVLPGDVYLYDIPTLSATCLSCTVDPEGVLDDDSPKISAEKVFWVQTAGTGITKFLYDIPAGTVSEAPDGFVWADNPQTSEILKVSTRHDGEDKEIFAADSALKAEHQVTNNTIADHSPCISGTNIVWVQGQSDGSEIFFQSDVGAPEADFLGVPLSGMKPLTVTFTDSSTGLVSAWSWVFGDGTTSDKQNPSHTYTTAGDFTVSFALEGPTGVDSKTRQGYIHVAEPMCECIFAPDSTDVAKGGSFGFQVTVRNNTSKNGVVLFGTKVRKPSGIISDYIWGPHNVRLTEHATVAAQKTHTVPDTFATGLYQYYGYVWTEDTGIIDVCSFEFEVIE